jgi:hypothetical protein
MGVMIAYIKAKITNFAYLVTGRWKRMPARVIYIVLMLDWKPWELASGGAQLALGTFFIFGANPILTAFNDTRDRDTILPWVMVVTGVGQLLGLALGSRSLRTFAGTWGALNWASLAYVFITTNPATTGTIMFPVMTLLTAWARIRAIIEKKEFRLKWQAHQSFLEDEQRREADDQNRKQRRRRRLH